MIRDRRTVSNNEMSRALRACRSGFLVAGIFSICVNLLLLTVPIYLFQVFDRVMLSGSLDSLIALTIGALVALLALSAFEILRRLVLTRVGMRIESSMAAPVLANSLQAGEGQGDLQGLRDLAQLRSFVTGPVVPLFFDALVAPLYLLIVYIVHPQLGHIALAGGVILFCAAVANQLLTTGPLRRSGAHVQQAFAQAQGHVRNAEVVRAMGMLPDSINLWGKENSAGLRHAVTASDRNAAITAVSRFVRLLLQIGILGWGAYLVILGEITGGMMMAASIIGARALAPVEGSIEGWRNAVQARQSYVRLKQLVSTRDDPDALELPAPKGRVSVEKLTYVPAGQREPILAGVSFKLKPGESLAVIGPTAAGKSTLSRLIAGALVPSSGCVRLDGTDVRHWNRQQFGAHVGYLPQSVELFPGSVSLNIGRMKESVDDADIVEAAQFACAHELVSGLPHGYQTVMGFDGAPLSGGQKQRIALARAFFGKPRLVVLDEPDANLDEEGEQALFKALANAAEAGVTVVVVTQRAALLRCVQKVLLLREGRVAAFGPRDEVLAQLMAGKQPARRQGAA